MGMMICGVALGFVMASALFIQKIWNMRDVISELKLRNRFYKGECVRLMREKQEWEEVNGAKESNLFQKF